MTRKVDTSTSHALKTAVSTVVATTAVGNIISVDAGNTLQLSRIRPLMRALECHGRKLAPVLDWTSHPTGLSLGSNPLFAEHMGAIVGNAAIMGGFFVLHGVATAAYGSAKHLSFSDAASTLEFPSRGITVIMYFFQPVVTSSLFVTYYADDVGARVLGVVTLLAALCFIGAVAWVTLGSMFTAVWVPLNPNESDNVKRAPSLVSRIVHYATKADGKWTDKTGSKGFCKRHGMYFKDYVGSYQGYLLAELGISVSLAVLDFQMITSITHCRILNGSLLGIIITQLGIMITLKHVAKRSGRQISIAGVVVQMVSASASLAKSMIEDSVDETDNESLTSQYLTTTATIAILLASFIFCVKTILAVIVKTNIFREWLHRKLSKKGPKTFDADMAGINGIPIVKKEDDTEMEIVRGLEENFLQPSEQEQPPPPVNPLSFLQPSEQEQPPPVVNPLTGLQWNTL